MKSPEEWSGWPPELGAWAETLVRDERAIGGVMGRARDRVCAVEALHRALACSARNLYERRKESEDYANWFRPWMVWKAANLLIDEFRRLRRWVQFAEEDEVPGGEDRSDLRKQLEVLREAIAELSPDEQRWLQWRRDGWTLEEMAAQEGCTPGTMHRRLREPLRLLRERMLEIDADLFAEFVLRGGADA